jgi:hypothetical protein
MYKGTFWHSTQVGSSSIQRIHILDFQLYIQIPIIRKFAALHRKWREKAIVNSRNHKLSLKDFMERLVDVTLDTYLRRWNNIIRHFVYESNYKNFNLFTYGLL